MKNLFLFLLLFFSGILYSQDGYYTDYAKAKENPLDVVTLDLRNDSITEEFYVFVNVKTVLLTNCKIAKLDSSVSNLQRLEFLRITQSDLSNVAKEVSYLKNLKYVDFSSNLISSIDFGENFSIVNLNLSENRITSLSGLSGLKVVENIFLAGNRIEVIDCSSFALPMLKSIDLSRNEISSFTGCSFDKPENLEKINLVKNEIQSLPNFFFNFPALSEVDLADNQLADVTLDWQKIRRLARLDLSGNPINCKKKKLLFPALKHLLLRRVDECGELEITSSVKGFKVVR